MVMEGAEAVWSFRSRVISVPGSFRSRVVSVQCRFGPWSFQSRIVSNRVISIQSFRFGVVLIPGVFGPGSFGPGSFRLRVISVPGRFVSASGHSGPGRFGPGSFRSHVGGNLWRRDSCSQDEKVYWYQGKRIPQRYSNGYFYTGY